jgi:hypothetical protein
VNVSRDEAARALEEIGRADTRMRRLSVYADMAPTLMLWGLIWVVNNLITEFAPALTERAWQVAMLVGTPLTLFLTIRHARRMGARIRQAGGNDRAIGRRMALMGATAFVFFAAVVAIVGPLDARRSCALISLFFAVGYAIGGIWGGWRLFTIGAVIAAAVVFGYLELQQHFFLWMSLVGGGALFTGGLWLRKA